MVPNMNRIHVLPALLAIFCGQSRADEKDAPKTGGTPASNASRLQWVLPALRAAHVQHRTFDSAAAKSQVSCFVYTPGSYDTEKERRFPVLYWLHGSGGGLPGVRPLTSYFDAAIQAGSIPPMLIVFANGLASSMWCDSVDGRMPLETIVVKELVPHIDASFRTIPTRQGRLVEGFSMGGYGAARLGFKYHDTFGAVSMLGAGPLDPQFSGPRATANPGERERILQSVFGGDLEIFKARSPWVLAVQHADAVRGRLQMRLVVGGRDNSLGSNRDFDAHLTQLKIPHTFTVAPRVGHDTMGVFNALGEENLKFYRAVFGPPAASGKDSSR